ncbi:integrase arm-type DNA-binding domain-containing protein [Francisella philomiragia]|uniref:tyrosine-type recombinase/integrase n=1 Tax=Francisella philomiragia TaxID=28110 RepID=UPI0019088995|nr:integrase arm-type DNA-binding domain-containing protein [Francisella philomiragia]MBK2093745.1 integrase arm-type DNA-binding domain-containing protein [Francisella philomiragia]
MRIPKTLSHKEVEALKKTTKGPRQLCSVGGVEGLHLQITNSGAKSWIFKYTALGTGTNGIKQKRKEMGLGSFPLVKLKDAREYAKECRLLLLNGVDPIADRKAKLDTINQEEQKKQITFEYVTRLWLEKKSQEWKNPKDFPRWTRAFERNIFPTLGKMPISEITHTHITETLKPIWTQIHDTSTKLRSYISNIFDFAIASSLYNELNPTPSKKQIEVLLPSGKLTQKINHHPALPYNQLPNFIKDLKAEDSIPSLALEFAILTASRFGQIAKASWDQFDFKKNVWIIPAEIMKGSASKAKPHTIPLSKRAIDVLNKVKKLANNKLVFPNSQGNQISDKALKNVILNLHENLKKRNTDSKGYIDPVYNKVITQHGFRSTFLNWVTEKSNYPLHVGRMALAHEIEDKVEAAYRRGNLLEKRALLMEEWAEYMN